MIVNLHRVVDGRYINAQFSEYPRMQIKGTTFTVFTKAVKNRCTGIKSVALALKRGTAASRIAILFKNKRGNTSILKQCCGCQSTYTGADNNYICGFIH